MYDALTDVIKSICAAEEEAEQRKIITEIKAREAVEEAKKAGKLTVEKTLARAESEITYLIRATDKKVTDDARELASKTANRQAALRARAERRLDAAATLIVERIVKL